MGRGAAPRGAREPRIRGEGATLQALRAAVEGGETPETAAADNVKSLAIVLGCVESVDSGEFVDVGELLATREAKL